MQRLQLNGAVVLVTGAASGIGAETVKAFARVGAHVVATDLDAAALETLKTELAPVAAIETAVLNVCDRAAWQKLTDELVASGKTPSVLINNAGIAFLGDFFEQGPEIWRRIFEVNLFGVLNGCQIAGAAMISAGGARHIVNVASLASIAPVPNMAAYAASKSAVEGLTTVLALELAGSQVAVTCVHPGIIDTPIVRENASVGASIATAQLDRLQAYYRSKGSHPAVVAGDILVAVQRGQGKVYTGAQAKLTAFLKRLLPYRQILMMSNSAAREAGYLP